MTKRTDSPVVDPAAKKQRLSNADKKRLSALDTPKSAPVDPKVEEFGKKFTQPEDAIQWLLSNSGMSVADFLKEKWEKAHLLMAAKEENKDLVKIFGMEWFAKMVKECEGENSPNELVIERDFSIERYADNARQDLDLEANLTEEALKKAIEDKYSVQMKQPQRFQAALHAFMEPLESYFGSLISADGYITPAGCQIIAPHYLDEECFVVQTEGSQTWKLYKSHLEYAVNFSGDLKRDEIGEPIETIKMKAGDVLYIPRGMIREAQADAEGTSSHLTLLTYNGQFVYRHLLLTIEELVERQVPKCEELRRGLPIGYLPGARSINREQVVEALTKLADSLREDKDALPMPEEMIAKFMSGRLPPYGLKGVDIANSKPPTAESKVRIRNKAHVTFYERQWQNAIIDEAMDEEDEANNTMNDEDEELKEEKELVVLSSVLNNAQSHGMIEHNMVDPMEDAIAMQTHFTPLMEKLMNAEEPIAVADLKGEDSKKRPVNTMMFVRALFNIGALEVVS